MSRIDQQYRRLDGLDRELKNLTIAALREVAEGRNTSLFVTETNCPWPELRRGSPVGNEIVARAREVIQLASDIGADTSGLAATTILRVFSSANDLENPHRLGPIRLASALLEELGQ